MSFHVGKTSILSTLDYIEDGRADIYEWGEKRRSKRTGISGKLYQIKKLFIDKSVLRSFVQNLTVIVVLQMVLAALGTFICQKFGLDFDVHMSIFVSPIVFPLAFSINADFQRRERVLEDLAQFKGALVILFFCHRDWIQASGLPTDFLKTVNHKLKGLVLNIKEYLLTEKVERRNYILAVIYEDLSDISQLNDKMRASSLPHNSPLITRLIHYHNLMCHAFERLRVIREYRSPRTIRSFTKVFIFLMPIVLSPYYVHMGIKSGNMWSPYYIAVLSSFMFGTLQGVQDVLDDPFDGISEDDINLGQLEDWTAHSLLTNRTITVGRFTVTTKAKDAKQLESGSDSDSDSKPGPKPKVIHPARVPQKRKPILRKPSFRRVDHGEEIREPQKSLYPETAHRLEDLARHGMTGSTTILPGMKLKRSNSDSLTANSSRASLAQEFFKAQGVDGSAQDPREFKKVCFSKETQGFYGDHGDFNNESGALASQSQSQSQSLPSDYARPEWMLDENSPLIVSDSRSGSPRSSCTGTSSLDTSEGGRPIKLPEEICGELTSSPGTSLIDGRFSVNKKKGDVPPSLANLFGNHPDRTPYETDGSSPAHSNKLQPDSMPSTLKNVFSPSENQDNNLPSSSSVSSPPRNTPRPRNLPIYPLARTDSPANTRHQHPYLPVSRISRSAPTSPEQDRKWKTFREISDPLTPSPEEAVAIPLASVTPQRSADYPLRKTSAARRFGVNTSGQVPPVHDLAQLASASSSPAERKMSGDLSAGNSRFAVKSSAQTPAVKSLTERSTSPSQRKNSSGNSAAENMEPSKAIDMPNSRFSVAKPSGDITSSQREDQPLVTTEVPNYGVTDPSPTPSVLTAQPSRFQVNRPNKISQDAAEGREDEDVSRRDSFELLTLDGESTEVYI